MHIALATCTGLPAWEVDDRFLHAALEADGFRISRPAWDDPKVDWAKFDACVIRTTWDYTKRPDDFRAWIERAHRETRLWNPGPVAVWNLEKTYLKELEGRGVRIVPTQWIEQGGSVDISEALHARGWSQAFLKPVIGASASETLRIRSEADFAEAQRHLDRTLTSSSMMLQPFFERVLLEGEFSAIFIDREITHAVRKIPVLGDYRVQDDYGARDERIILESNDEHWARAVLEAAAGDLLYARVDFLRDSEGQPHLVELELIEPSLFFRHGAEAAHALSSALSQRLE